MAREPIVYIDRNKQLYKGRDAQVAALAPFPARHDGDHWAFTRAPFAHAFFPGYGLERTGKEDPRLKAIKQAAIDAGVALELVEALTLDQLMVTPEFISGNVGGITFRTRLQTMQRPIITPDAALYEPTGETGQVNVHVAEENAVRNDAWLSQIISAPAVLRKLTISGGTSAVSPDLPKVLIEPIGWSTSFGDVGDSAGNGKVDASYTIDHWLTTGNAFLKVLCNTGAGSTDRIYINATLTFERLRGKA